MSYKIQVKV